MSTSLINRGRRARLTRREFLKLIGVTGASAVLVSGCQPAATASPSPAPTKALAFDWQRFKGESVRVIDLQLFDEQLTLTLLQEFEQATGIKAVYERYEQAQARQKIATEFTAGGSSLDAFFTTRMQDGAQYFKNGWYHPLDSYLADPSLVSPDYDFADFSQASIDDNTLNGQLIGMPILLDSQVLFYRRDIFETKGVEPPTTFDELEAVAKKINDPSNNVYGIVSRGQASSSVSMFAGFLHNFGGDWFTDGKPSINTPEAVEAYKFYGHLLREYGPPGVVNVGASDLEGVFGAGLAAMCPDGASWMPTWQGEASKVKGQIGTAKMPAGPTRDTPTIYGYAVAMSSQSKKKEATWYFLQWMTTKAVALRLQIAGIGSGRESIWSAPEFLQAAEADWADANLASFKIGNPNWLPPVISIPEARDIVGQPVVVSVEGGDVKAACDKANEALTDLAKRDGVLAG